MSVSMANASTRSSSSSLTLPDVTMDTSERNPGMTSGEDTPGSNHPDALPDGVHVLTPPTNPAPEIEILEGRRSTSQDGEHTYPAELATHNDAITKDDVAADPILNDLADSQGSGSSFRSRPAPDSTHYSGLGPRLSKSAALRMKLKWEDPREQRRVSGEDVPVNFDNVPGHKRAGLELVSPPPPIWCSFSAERVVSRRAEPRASTQPCSNVTRRTTRGAGQGHQGPRRDSHAEQGA